MKGDRKYLFLLLLGTAFWGISIPLTKEGISFVHPFVFLTYRFLIATLVLFLFFFKRVINIDAKTVKYGVITALPLVAAIGLQTICLQYTSSSNAAFIAGTDVLLVPVLKFIVFKNMFPRKVWLASIVAFIGLSIIAIDDNLELNIGDIIAIVGAVGFAVYIIMVGKLAVKEYDITASVVVQMAICCLFCLALSMTKISSPAQLLLPSNPVLWQTVLFSGILGTAYMYCIQNIAQKHIEDEKVALTYLCEPIFATLAAFFLLGEAITPRTIIGGGLILFSLFFAEYKFNRLPTFRRRDPKEERLL